MSEQWFERDPLWFKRAVFYEIHIRGFFDGNDDGSGDFRGPDRQARLSRVARRRLPLAAADVRVAAARRRLRHLELLRPPPGLRVGGRLPGVRRAGAPARHARHRRPRHEPHLGRPSVVRGVAGGPHQPEERLVRLVGHGGALSRGPRHLHRHRALELDARPAPRRVLLAPLLPPPARPQLRQPRGAGGDARGAALLARPRNRRLPARRRALPLRARRDERREPPGDARVPQTSTRPRSTRAIPTGCSWPRRTSGPRTSWTTSATATSARCASTSR